MRILTLEQKIEQEREKMHCLIERYGATHIKTIEQSQKLDELINEMMARNNHA